MDLQFSRQIKILSLCFMGFGFVIGGVELAFSLIFKETLYYIMLVFAALLSFILMFVAIYAWKFKLSIDENGFYISKIFGTRSYTYQKDDIKEINLTIERRNVNVTLIDSKSHKITSFTCNNLSDEQFKLLQELLNKDVKINIIEEEKFNVD